MSILPGIYPLEVFPTAVRSSGEGVASTASRIGAAIGTFLLPICLVAFGLPPVLIALAIVCLIGGVTSVFLAPETAGKTLSETGSKKGVDRLVRRSCRMPRRAVASGIRRLRNSERENAFR